MVRLNYILQWIALLSRGSGHGPGPPPASHIRGTAFLALLVASMPRAAKWGSLVCGKWLAAAWRSCQVTRWCASRWAGTALASWSANGHGTGTCCCCTRCENLLGLALKRDLFSVVTGGAFQHMPCSTS